MVQSSVTAIAALLLVVGLVFGLSWILRRFGAVPGMPARLRRKNSLEILEVRPIDPRSRLVVARWKDKTYLLGVGMNGVSLLDQKPHAETKDGNAFSEDNPVLAAANDEVKRVK